MGNFRSRPPPAKEGRLTRQDTDPHRIRDAPRPIRRWIIRLPLNTGRRSRFQCFFHLSRRVP